ncbi:MAG TPA: cytidylate kinase-like family protein [Candidatus Binatia bacterium]|jgi:cytidylate kinase
MPKLSSAETRAIAPLAERQLRRWAGTLASWADPSQRRVERLPEDVKPFVALSRQAGAGGEDVGRLVAAALGCECLDRELLTRLAESEHLPRILLEFVDETTSTLVREVFSRWLDARVITQDEFVRRLGHLMLIAAHDGPAVFVGRGAQFILPRDKALAVYVIAPLERRVADAMTRRQLDHQAAEAWVRDTDEDRAHFIRHQFHADPTDPRLYDLTINLEWLDQQTAARTIVEAYRQRFGRSVPAGGRVIGATSRG